MPTSIAIPTFVLVYIILPLIVGVFAFIVRNYTERLSKLEERMEHTVTESQTRVLINDRYDPLAQDIREIKEKLDKLFDMYMEQLKDKGN